MPRSVDRRQMWAGVGSGWSHLSTLISGVAVYGAIGYGLDRLFGTWPILFMIGAMPRTALAGNTGARFPFALAILTGSMFALWWPV